MQIIKSTHGCQYSELIASGQNGTIYFAGSQKTTSGGLTCTLIAGSSTGKFQFSTSSKGELEAGTATWQDWDNGVSTGTVTDVLAAAVTAVRGVSVSGGIKIELVY